MKRRELPVSTTVGDAYRVVRRIGEGARGTVYEVAGSPPQPALRPEIDGWSHRRERRGAGDLPQPGGDSLPPPAPPAAAGAGLRHRRHRRAVRGHRVPGGRGRGGPPASPPGIRHSVRFEAPAGWPPDAAGGPGPVGGAQAGPVSPGSQAHEPVPGAPGRTAPTSSRCWISGSARWTTPCTWRAPPGWTTACRTCHPSSPAGAATRWTIAATSGRWPAWPGRC